MAEGQVSLLLPELPGLVLSKMPGEAEDFCIRSSVEAIRLGERLVTGVDTLLGGGIQFFQWSFQLVVSWDELTLFEEMRARQQSLFLSQLNGNITLLDERFSVSPTEAGRANRTIIRSRATSWGSISFISCPVFVRIPENHFQQIAKDMFLLKFDAKEIF